LLTTFESCWWVQAGVPNGAVTNNVGNNAGPPPTLQLQEQSQALERLRAEVCAAQAGAGQTTLGWSAGQECVKDKINNVLGQALQLVQTLEQMQGAAGECQGQAGTAPNPFADQMSQAQGVQGGLNQQDICNQIHCLVKYMDQLSQQFDNVLGNPNCPYHDGTYVGIHLP